jgi:NAD(P)-dependent dehydrogenase (short-subunit alcohol dehydrogenase family)
MGASTVRFVKQSVPYLEKCKGNIVIISSCAGRYVLSPSQRLSVYGAPKAGLNQFTRAVALGLTRGEYSDEGLKHNDIATQERIRSVIPLGRIGEPGKSPVVEAALMENEV